MKLHYFKKIYKLIFPIYITLKQFSYKFYQIHNVNKRNNQTIVCIDHLEMQMPNLNFSSKYN